MNRNDLDKYITDTYGAVAEYVWEKHPTFAIYRHQNNNKWFAVIMEIPKSKIGLDDEGLVKVVAVRLQAGSLIRIKLC